MTKLGDLSFDPSYTKADVQAAIDFLDERQSMFRRKEGYPDGCVNGVFTGVKDGKKVGTTLHGYCHAALNKSSYNTTMPEGCSLIATITHPPEYCNVSDYTVRKSPKPEGYDIEAVRFFYDWLINQSPFGRFLVETDVDSALNRGLIISTDVPGNVLAMICIMSRHQREKHGHMRGWVQLITEHGFSPEMAWFWAFNTNFFENVPSKKLTLADSAYAIGAGHDLFYAPSVEMVRNWTNDFDAVSLQEQTYRNCPSYAAGVSAMFGKYCSGKDAFIGAVNEEIKKIKKGATEETKTAISNPFAAAYKTNTNGYVTISKNDFLNYGKEACARLWAK